VSLTGKVYWRNGHIWVVISVPSHRSGKLLYVNLTTLDNECVDDECILSTADYGWIKHRTAVAFTRALIAEARQFNEAIRLGLLQPGNPPSVPDQCLAKIQKAALTSKHLSNEKKMLLPGFK